MATEFHLPDVGEGLAEAVILEWHVAVGEEVDMDGPLVEVETDKAVVDIPSPVAGVLLHRGAQEGETLAVEALLAVVGQPGETWQPAAPATPPAAAVASDEALPIVGTLEEATSLTSRVQALPAVRKLAADLGIALEGLVGSGSAGRITDQDVRNAADTGKAVRRVPMSPTRRAIADNMMRSWHEIPHVTTYGEADAGALMARRVDAGKPPLEALLIALITPILRDFPGFNAAVQGTDIVERLHYDIGFAVDTPEGLLVAVVADAADKTLAELSDEVVRLSAAARERRAKPDELRGQTFTISNIGAAGGRYGTPLVPVGTSAILSVGRAEPRPVVRNGEIVVGTEFPLSLAYDHRIVDGATGRRFLAAVVEAIERADV